MNKSTPSRGFALYYQTQCLMWVEVKGKNLAQLTTTVPSAFSTICQTRRAEHAKTREPDGVLLFLFWQSLDVYTRVSADLHTSTINQSRK